VQAHGVRCHETYTVRRAHTIDGRLYLELEEISFDTKFLAGNFVFARAVADFSDLMNPRKRYESGSPIDAEDAG
jgi:hypothetical protein